MAGSAHGLSEQWSNRCFGEIRRVEGSAEKAVSGASLRGGEHGKDR